MGLENKLAKMEAKLNPDDAAAAKERRRQEQEERREKKKERKQIRGMAAKSLDVSNWTAQLLDGAQAKFSATVENEVEEKLQKATVGLVTYEELKAKKETIERELEEKKSEEDRKRKAEERQRDKKQKKAKATLSFDADEDGDC